MKFMSTFFVGLALLLLSGCQLHQVKGEVEGVEIEAETTEHKNRDHDHKSDSGHFCPPGQAKKGNC